MKHLIFAAFAGLLVGQAAASTAVNVSGRDALVTVTAPNNSTFDAVIRIQPTVANSLILGFSALDGQFSTVKYSFWLDQGLTNRVQRTDVVGGPTADYAVRRVDDMGNASASFASGVALIPFDDAARPSFDLAAQPYFLRLTGTMVNGGGDLTGQLKVTASNAMIAAVPEPETYAMFLAGLGVIGAIAGRRRHRQN